MDLAICSYNLRGFRSGFGLLNDMCKNYSIIAVQEHWLRPDELDKLALVHSDFNFSAVSGMNKGLCDGILAGRPFGGVGFLWHRSLNNCVEVVQCDPEGRCIVINVRFGSRSLLLFNLYLPCCDNSCEYKNEINFYAGFITDILEVVDHTDVILLGDFNFPVV
jgi:exonuclease III